VVGSGNNHLPTIHVRDLASALETLLLQEGKFNEVLIAVDSSANQTLKDFMTVISQGIGSG